MASKIFLAILILISTCALAEPAPQTLTISARTHRVEVELSGTFEARNASAVTIPAKSLDSVKLAWVAEPGLRVRKGDVILKLDMSDALASHALQEAAEQLAEAAFTQAQEDLRQSEIATAFSLAQAERAIEMAREDFDYWMRQEWPFTARRLELDARGNDIQMETVQMELSELKRMYEADDLVETTEGLVLRRVEQSTARATVGWEREKIKIMYERQVLAPRELEAQQRKLRTAEMQYESTTKSLPLALQKKQSELAKMTAEREQARAKFKDVLQDLKIREITAPADGIVYYGECRHGAWNSGEIAKQLVPGGKVPAKTVLLTIVDTADLFVRAPVEEKDLGKFNLTESRAVRIRPTGFPAVVCDGELEVLSTVPAGHVKFFTLIGVKNQPDYIVPGMTCRAAYVVYENEKAIVVPRSAVFGDEENGFYVHAAGAERAEKRMVHLGIASNGDVEIIEGLNEGDVILLEGPK